MCEPVGGVPPLGCDRVQQAHTKVAHLARFSGKCDCKTFSLALTCHFVSIFPRVPQYTVCLFDLLVELRLLLVAEVEEGEEEDR